ncbi:hypothetical protein SSX86_014761 [Deinandra increscens subsp. villosa]|uniref:F-box domain-containing protein n=1 Tax=Deinandra increscens subsp. villosa TaxID=3103831 RepID=A0AAP0D705_9ASTR
MSSSSGINLPPEITEAILRLLPVKSLGRFKSVSKTWYSLISDPQFIKTHLHKTRKLILVSDTKSLFSLDVNDLLPSLTSEDDISATGKEVKIPIMWEQIWGSSNGLVLAEDGNDTIFFINPTTKEIWKVPPSPFALPVRESFVMYGFGYDSSTDDYKIVSISFWGTDNEHNPDCDDMFVTVYSLRNNSWRKLRNSPYDHSIGHVIRGVLVNQNIHWLASTRPDYASTIVAFSLAKEEFNVMGLPDSVENGKAVFNVLFAVVGKLGVFDTQTGSLWLMGEYGVGESWTKVCMDGLEIDPFGHAFLVEGSGDRDIVLCDDDGVRVYDMDERRCRKVRIEGGPSGIEMGGAYFESLESPSKCVTRI